MMGKMLVLTAIAPHSPVFRQGASRIRVTSRKIERMMFTFVWGSQMEQLKHSTLHKAVENGGKGIPDIPSIIRAQEPSNLVNNIHKTDRKASYFELYFVTPIPRTLRRRITILLRDHAITDFHKDPDQVRAVWGVAR